MSRFKREEAEATVLLNEPVLASVLVAPFNTFSLTKQIGTHLLSEAVGGLIAGGVEAVIDRKAEKEQSVKLLPQMLLIVSQTQVALFRWKQGILRNSLGQVLFRAPKTDVVSCEVGLKTKSLLTQGLTLELVGGIRIELESHFSLKKYCYAVKSALNK